MTYKYYRTTYYVNLGICLSTQLTLVYDDAGRDRAERYLEDALNIETTTYEVNEVGKIARAFGSSEYIKYFLDDERITKERGVLHLATGSRHFIDYILTK